MDDFYTFFFFHASISGPRFFHTPSTAPGGMLCLRVVWTGQHALFASRHNNCPGSHHGQVAQHEIPHTLVRRKYLPPVVVAPRQAAGRGFFFERGQEPRRTQANLVGQVFEHASKNVKILGSVGKQAALCKVPVKNLGVVLPNRAFQGSEMRLARQEEKQFGARTAIPAQFAAPLVFLVPVALLDAKERAGEIVPKINNKHGQLRVQGRGVDIHPAIHVWHSARWVEEQKPLVYFRVPHVNRVARGKPGRKICLCLGGFPHQIKLLSAHATVYNLPRVLVKS